MDPDRSKRVYFMVLQAFCDESYSKEKDGFALLVAHVADVDSWAAFSKEWKESLPWGVFDRRHDEFHFHMTEMALSNEGMQRSMRFMRIMEKHVKLTYSVSVMRKDIERAKLQLFVPGFSLEHPALRDIGSNVYLLMYRFMMDTFHMKIRQAHPDLIPPDSPVDFYFDDAVEEKPIRDGWEQYLGASGRAEVRKLYGNKPRFESDRIFLPLQAADLWAWWMRKWSENVDDKGNFIVNDFGPYKPPQAASRKCVHAHIKRSNLAEFFVSEIHRRAKATGTTYNIGGSRVYNVRFGKIAWRTLISLFLVR